MPLTPPTLADFLSHAELPSVENERRVEKLLQLSTDLLEIASGLDTEPATGTLASRIALEGKLAMAHALWARSADREEMYSPYSSERLGSYSYNRAQRDILQGLPTGVFEFDLATSYLKGEIDDEMLHEVWSTSTRVFLPEVESWEPPLPWYGGLGVGRG